MDPYVPNPNPPGEPKPCQGCGMVVDGDEIDGWWLERETWQGPNYYQLRCLPCCVDAMNEASLYPDVADADTARAVLHEAPHR